MAAVGVSGAVGEDEGGVEGSGRAYLSDFVGFFLFLLFRYSS